VQRVYGPLTHALCCEVMMQITLLRHGKPAFELKGSVRGKDLGMIAKSYDLSDIVGTPPRKTVAAIQGEHFVVCSHLPRSVESAKALGYTEVHIRDPLYCETAIPHFSGGSIPLPIGFWIIILRLMWLFGFSRNGESLADARRRARRATTRLIELAEEHQNVLLVGHGFINYLIANELRKGGWNGPSKPGRGYWGYGRYERATT
jgi:broad specificity phosphatase PhoE